MISGPESVEDCVKILRGARNLHSLQKNSGADPGIKLTAAQHRKHLRQGRGSKLTGCHT